ncbi:MAG TPA: hypothetical protein VH278_02520 [Burkholderiaceae bacterium]|nr:hypothetical protein [Burkholderiaceae bacterium]
MSHLIRTRTGEQEMAKTQNSRGREQQRTPPRKILLDSDIYCPYSMRESHGDVHCDHDFEDHPNVTEASFAIWNCTICGRAVRFDVWN